MSPLAGPLHAAAVVLLVAGVAKGGRPSAAGAALRAAGLPGSRTAVRALACAEIAVGAAVLAGWGARAAAALAAFHLGFGAVALALRRAAAGCGCFGAAAPVTGAHLAVNLAVAGLGLAATVDAVPSIGEATGAASGAGPAYLVLVGALAFAEVLCLTALAEVQDAAGSWRRRAGAAG